MNNIEDINNMKEMWIELNKRIISLEEDNKRLAREVINKDYKTARERLISKYIKFIIIEAIMALYMVLFFSLNPEIVEKYRLVSAIYWGVFFLLEVIWDSYLMYGIKKLNITEMSVSQIAKQSARIWKFHKIAIATGLPLAFGALVLFALSMGANRFVYFGMAVGVIVGLTIGIFQLKKFRQYYRLLQTEE